MSLPLRLELTGRTVVVVGGGPAAARHARRYREEGAQVLVIAEGLCDDLADLVTGQPEAEPGGPGHAGHGLGRLVHRLAGAPGADRGSLSWRPRGWRPDDLEHAWLVHAATGQQDGDAQVVAAAQEARVWCLADSAAAAASASGQPDAGVNVPAVPDPGVSDPGAPDPAARPATGRIAG